MGQIQVQGTIPDPRQCTNHVHTQQQKGILQPQSPWLVVSQARTCLLQRCPGGRTTAARRGEREPAVREVRDSRARAAPSRGRAPRRLSGDERVAGSNPATGDSKRRRRGGWSWPCDAPAGPQVVPPADPRVVAPRSRHSDGTATPSPEACRSPRRTGWCADMSIQLWSQVCLWSPSGLPAVWSLL